MTREHGGFLLLLQSGAGGYLCATDENDAQHRTSYVEGHSWLLHCELDGYIAVARNRRRARRSGHVGRAEWPCPFALLDLTGPKHRGYLTRVCSRLRRVS